MVGQMLGEDDEGHRDVGDGEGGYVFAVDGAEAFKGLQEGEIGEPLHIVEEREVDDLKVGVAGGYAYHREYCGDGVAGDDTDYEGYHLKHLFAVDRADHDAREGDESADEADPAARGCPPAGSG